MRRAVLRSGARRTACISSSTRRPPRRHRPSRCARASSGGASQFSHRLQGRKNCRRCHKAFQCASGLVYLHLCLQVRGPPIQSPRCHHGPPRQALRPSKGSTWPSSMLYTHVLGRPPAEADLQRHFGVSPPSVHQMVLTLERTRLIRRKPGVARSIESRVAPGPTLSRSKLIKLRAELLPTEATSNKVSPPEYDRYLWVV